MNYKMDDSSNTVEIMPRQKDVAIIYKNEESSSLYVAANPEASPKFQLSVVNFLPGESLDIEQNGFYYEQNDITITGYWAWEKVADMLPYDFKEKQTTNVEREVNETPFVPEKKVPEPVKEETNPIKQEPVVSGGLLTASTWQMQESRVIDGNNMYYYQRGGQENTVNFDNDLYKFETDNTGIYFYNGQQYKFNWKYLDAEKTKMEMIILYPTPLIVNFENISLTATSFKYTPSAKSEWCKLCGYRIKNSEVKKIKKKIKWANIYLPITFSQSSGILFIQTSSRRAALASCAGAPQ